MSRTKNKGVAGGRAAADVQPTKAPRWMVAKVAAIAKLRGQSQHEVWEAVAGERVNAEFDAAVAAVRRSPRGGD